MLPLSPESLSRIEALLGGPVTNARAVGGGCINENFLLETAGGAQAFLKWNPSAPADFFQAEVRGLDLLRGAAGAGSAGCRVPEVLGCGVEDPWLLLEYVAPGHSDGDYWRALGAGLSELHGATSGPDSPNFLGTIPQSVAPQESWPGFWIEERVLPRLNQAREQGRVGRTDDRAWDRLLGALPRALPRIGPEGLGLLHGDLWSGNVFPDPEGRPVLVDPAVYLGDGRVDLAMAELFGGFSTTFFHAYEQRRPVGQVYEALLRDAYQLYPLLVHINLFGTSYVGGAMERVHRLLANLGG